MMIGLTKNFLNLVPPSASSKKIETVPNIIDSFSSNNNNRIKNIDNKTQALLCVTVCKQRKFENSLTLTKDEESRQRLACKLVVQCSKCLNSYTFWTSHKTNNIFDINVKCVCGLREQ